MATRPPHPPPPPRRPTASRRVRPAPPRRAPAAPRDTGTALRPRHDRTRLLTAFVELLAALGAGKKREQRATATRAAELWGRHLLAGEHADLAAILRGGSRSRNAGPVVVLEIGLHLVCPHHLTVAFGYAHVAYVPGPRLAGFGALARLVQACSARLALQEHVTAAIAQALVDHLDVRAAAVVIDALHPCHNVLHPRSHRAHAVTVAERGEPSAARDLARALRLALSGARPTTTRARSGT